MNRLIHTLAASGAAVLVIASLAVAAPAAAAPAGAAAGRFAAQAQQAHLSVAQVSQLQREVDAMVAKTGGTQTAINQISIYGADILLPLPGEAKARNFNPGVTLDGAGCPYYNFCAYENSNYLGRQINYYYCVDTYMPYITIGAYDNNQSPYTIATFKGSTHAIIGYSITSGKGGVSPFNWQPVYYIKPC
jgi:hypothetical protein